MHVLNMSNLVGIRFILRLSVITVVMIYQLNITQSSRSCVVTKNNTKGGEIEVLGETTEFCYLPMITRSSVVVLEASSTSSPFYVYLEREYADHCSNGSYAMINGQACQVESCYAVFTMFTQNRFQLNLQGNISISLKEIQSMDQSIHVYSECIEYDQDFTENINVSSNVKCKVKWYQQVISCNPQNDKNKEYCRISFPKHCNASLGYREVKCVENEEENQIALLVYPDIERLNLRGNNILNINNYTFYKLSDLKEIYLDWNQLQHLPIGVFDNLGDLIVIGLSFNQLVSIDKGIFEDLQKLVELYFYGNRIKTIESGCLQNLAKLALLNLGYNMLTSLPTDTFQGLHSLKQLYIERNQIKTIETGCFPNLANLTHLSLGYNMLTSLPTDMFQGLHNLLELELNRNQIKTIQSGCFQNLTNLTDLSLGYNMLTSLPTDTFQGLHSLKELYVYANQNMTSLPRGLLHNLTQLTSLLLRSNTIMTIETESFKDLRELVNLFLHQNALAHLYSGIFTGMGNLELLLIGSNLLRSIDPDVFHPLSKLKSLGLSNNMLTELNTEWFQGLTNLETLFLGGNRFHTMRRGMLTGLTKLKILALPFNQLDKLDIDLFYETLNLDFLDMEFNRLQNIPNIKHLVNLKNLNIRGNPLLQIKKLTLPIDIRLEVSQHEICKCFVSTNMTNITCSASDPRSPYLTCNRLLADRALVAMMWLISLNAIGGNVFVLAWKQRHGQKNSVQDLLLSNLAISDTIMGIYMLIIACADVYFGKEFPMYSESWRAGITCRTAGGLSILSSEASVFFVTLISIDRFICVKFPFTIRKLSKRSARLAITLIWLFSLALEVVPSSLAGRSEQFYDNSHVCIGLPLSLTSKYSVTQFSKRIENGKYFFGFNTFNTTYHGEFHGKHFSNVIFLGVNGLCYLVILACYIEIVHTTLKSSKRSGLNKELKDELRMTLKVTAIVATDFCCWFPIILLGILVQTTVITLPASVYAWCVTFVIPINSAINPYLYTISNVISDWRKQKAKRQKQLENDTGEGN